MSMEPIAVVGLAVRVPDAGSADEFWANLLAGRNSIHRLSDQQLLDAGENPELMVSSSYVKARPLLDDVWGFDNEYFGISRRESELRNPQHRLFMELCDTALQSASTMPRHFDGAIGVYGGSATDRFLEDHFRADQTVMDQVGETVALVSNNPDFMPSYVSYRLGLRGPSVAVRTACSTSLVAVHFACQALRSGDCDLALAGGVEIETPYGRGYSHVEGGIDSQDGVCRPLDAEASGTVFGSGGGVVALKRLSDAELEGDEILAVVRGSAVNNDGPDRAGFTTPSSDGQSQVIAEAITVSDIDSASISYVELHGTGTKIGDPVEIRGLHHGMKMTAQSELTPDSCMIGSAKSNIGHLGPGSGVVGLIKTVLALYHEKIPQTINVREVNPDLHLERTPFAVATSDIPWPKGTGSPRRAGVSSFGFGGTNAHAVLEEPPKAQPRLGSGESELLVWSGTDGHTRDQFGEALLSTVASATVDDLPAIARTTHTGRRALQHRAALRIDTPETARGALTDPDMAIRGDGQTRYPVLLFPGQGAQRPAMGLDAGRWLPRHADRVRSYLTEFSDLLGKDLVRLWEQEEGSEELARTVHAQPLLFSVELATAQSLYDLGVSPEVVVGHSIGEVVAATFAGVFQVGDAIQFVAERARLMQQMPAGTMVAVAAPVGDVRRALTEDVWVSAVNSWTQTVVGGAAEAVMDFCSGLDDLGVRYRELSTSHAFHTPMMGEAVEQFLPTVGKMQLSKPRLPLVSAASGRLLDDKDALRPEFWANQLVEPVLFADALDSVPVTHPVFAEAGPSPALGGLARQHPAVGGSGHPVLELLSDRPDHLVLDGLGELWAYGADIDIARLSGKGGRTYPLPTYPYQRTDFLLPDRSGTSVSPPVEPSQYAGLSTSSELDRQPVTALPTWWPAGVLTQQRLAITGQRGSAVVVLPEDRAAADTIRRAVQRAGYRALPIAYGDQLDVNDYSCVIRRGHSEDLDVAFAALNETDQVELIVHAVGSGPTTPDAPDYAVSSLLRVYDCATGLRRRLGRALPVVVVTRGAVAVTASESVEPAHAATAAVVRAAAAEHGVGTARMIDVADVRGDALAAEIASPAYEDDQVVALRGSRLWRLDLEQYSLPEFSTTVLQNHGRYVITDGLGTKGLAVARALAHTGLQPRLVLLTRDPGCERIDIDLPRHIAALEAAGAEVTITEADLADYTQTAALFEWIAAEHGPVHGILHTLESQRSGNTRAALQDATRSAVKLRDVACATATVRFLALLTDTGPFSSAGDVVHAAASGFVDALAKSSAADSTAVLSLRLDSRLSEDQAASTALRMLTEQSEPHIVVVPVEQWAQDRTAPRFASWEPSESAQQEPVARPSEDSADPAAVISSLWAETLGHSGIAADADFFDIGADSLMALQMASRLQERFGVEMSVAEIFDAPTARQLAASIGAKQR